MSTDPFDTSITNINGSASKRSFHWMPGIIRKDFWRKLIALFFALLVYYAVQITQLGAERSISGIPVEIEMPKDLVNISAQVPKVTITVRGSQRRIKELSPGDFKVKLRVNEADFVQDSQYPLRISPQDVQSPHLIKVLKVRSLEEGLTLERKDRRRVEIRPQFNSLSKLPGDYTVSGVKFTPEKVWVTGPVSQVRNIESIQTEQIPLDDTTVDSFEYEVSLVAPKRVTVDPVKVAVLVTVKREFVSRVFHSVPIRQLKAADAAGVKVELLSTPNVDITVNGPKGKIAELKSFKIKPYVDLSGLEEPGSYNVTCECWLAAPGITVKNIYPSTIKVRILRTQKKKK
jgi:YbbR domain-containing protein